MLSLRLLCGMDFSSARSDRARWITALMHREKEKPDTTPKGDLSQVEITQPYLAKQADEISLQQADVVLVLGGEDAVLGSDLCRVSGATIFQPLMN
ncbi:hypothetical protein AAES_161139 [Amazona aestiva]|uniref:Uncharacterized protein n=1 Tax=Amazona aestiva TaxID=12930 RepID=A0A0Q3UQQ7_AMAAE|nr:hypothetical protein AAES_161139 [Amazona aestiva]